MTITDSGKPKRKYTRRNVSQKESVAAGRRPKPEPQVPVEGLVDIFKNIDIAKLLELIKLMRELFKKK